MTFKISFFLYWIVSSSCSCLSAIYTAQEIQSMLYFSLPCRHVKMPPISAFMMYVILQTNPDTFPDVLKKLPINAFVIRVILLMNSENFARSFLIAHMAVRYSLPLFTLDVNHLIIKCCPIDCLHFMLHHFFLIYVSIKYMYHIGQNFGERKLWQIAN